MVDLFSSPMLEEDTSQNRRPSGHGRAEPEDIVLPEARTEVGDNAAQLAGSRLAVLRAPQFVQQHFHEKFPASAIAKYCGLSRFQFSRSFHHVFGITFREYLLRYRIREACVRLAQGTAPVTEIAYAVGFHDGSYFARMFRRYTGMLPSQYARAHGQNSPDSDTTAAARG
jgi:AraC-like DNA-binding protein